MKLIIIMSACIGWLTTCCFGQNQSMHQLTGHVIDNENSQPIPEVSVFIPEYKMIRTTDRAGYFQFDQIPGSGIQIQFTSVGYSTKSMQIYPDSQSYLTVFLAPSNKELPEVVITGQSRAMEIRQSPSSVKLLTKDKWLQQASGNLMDVIGKQAGVSLISSGPAISKPAIRGLGYNRLLVINDGIRQEGQQWGDEHGIEIDEYRVEKVEILKGPASLAYGSDALAGVIQFFSTSGIQDQKLKGSVLLNYQSNNNLIAGSLQFGGNTKGWLWDLRGSTKSAQAYKNKSDGRVYNSAYSERSLSLQSGLAKSWGSSYLTLSSYHLNAGLPEGERDSIGQFLKTIADEKGNALSTVVDKSDLNSYRPGIPSQKIYHYKIVSNSLFVWSEAQFRSILGWQQNRRNEFADFSQAEEAQMSLVLNSLTYDFNLNFSKSEKIQSQFGINGMHQQSVNHGAEYLIPDYSVTDGGAYAIAEKKKGKLFISAGLRYDLRQLQSKSLYLDSNGLAAPNGEEKFIANKRFFHNWSGSAGLSWQLNKNSGLKLNIARGYRAPSIAELSSNGVHEGSQRYEIGNPDLDAEKSVQLDLGLFWYGAKVRTEVNLFHNYINDFIYIHSEYPDRQKDNHRIFNYTQSRAQLMGFEMNFDLQATSYLSIENSLSILNARRPGSADSAKYLPFTPPGKYQVELRLSASRLNGWLANSYFSTGMEFHFRQDKIYRAFETETETAAYSLLQFKLGTEIRHQDKTVFRLFVMVNNIFDVVYQDHLSRLKYAAGNPFKGTEGLSNMGRNFSVKLIFPLQIERGTSKHNKST